MYVMLYPWHVRNVRTPSFYSAPYLQLVGYCFKAK
jgi:hypothetical protein